MDSVKCKDCYKDEYSENRVDGRWTKYEFVNCNSLKVGVWIYYHPNGQLKMIGEYHDMVHAYNGISYPLSWEAKSWPSPRNVYREYEYLKKGTWEYYDEAGNHILTEEFANGALVFRTERY